MVPIKTLKRLQSDLKELRQTPIHGAHAEPVNDNILIWHANIIGRKETAYDGACIHFALEFPDNYPIRGPKAFFVTPVNSSDYDMATRTDDKGRTEVCVDILNNFAQEHSDWGKNNDASGWVPSYTVSSILIVLRSLFLDKLSTHESSIKRVKQAVKCVDCGHDNSTVATYWPAVIQEGCCPSPTTSTDSTVAVATSPSTSVTAASEPVEPVIPPTKEVTDSVVTKSTTDTDISFDDDDITNDIMCYVTKNPFNHVDYLKMYELSKATEMKDVETAIHQKEEQQKKAALIREKIALEKAEKIRSDRADLMGKANADSIAYLLANSEIERLRHIYNNKREALISERNKLQDKQRKIEQLLHISNKDTHVAIVQQEYQYNKVRIPHFGAIVTNRAGDIVANPINKLKSNTHNTYGILSMLGNDDTDNTNTGTPEETAAKAAKESAKAQKKAKARAAYKAKTLADAAANTLSDAAKAKQAALVNQNKAALKSLLQSIDAVNHKIGQISPPFFNDIYKKFQSEQNIAELTKEAYNQFNIDDTYKQCLRAEELKASDVAITQLATSDASSSNTNDDTAPPIFGYGINIKSSNSSITITSPGEFISKEGYDHGVRNSSTNQMFSDWLPAYVTENHWLLAKPLFLENAVLIYNNLVSKYKTNGILIHDNSMSSLNKNNIVIKCFWVVASLLNSTLTAKEQNEYSFSSRIRSTISDKDVTIFLNYYKILKAMAHEYPQLIKYANKTLTSMRDSMEHWNPEIVINLGEYLFLTVISSDYGYAGIAERFIVECDARGERESHIRPMIMVTIMEKYGDQILNVQFKDMVADIRQMCNDSYKEIKKANDDMEAQKLQLLTM